MKKFKRKNTITKLFTLIILLIALFIVKNIKDISYKYKYSNEEGNYNLNIYFFDVGQADSILISKDKYSVLIDAGNNNDGLNLVNYLKDELNIKHIDYLIGTHPHEDHVGGFDDIINSFDIDKIYMPNQTTNTKTFEDVLDAIESKNYTITIPNKGDSFALDDLLFEVLYVGENEKDLNSSSIVLKLKYINNSFLFMGDAPSNVEKGILDNNIKADVLKVGHHGSNYSSDSEFLKKVNPKYAIISVGKNNSYNHPGDNTLKKLKDNNIKIYRTDESGTIHLKSDGNNIEIETIKTNIDGG